MKNCNYLIPFVRWDSIENKAKKDYQRCPSTLELHRIIFFDPYDETHFSQVSICGTHHRELIEDVDKALRILRLKVQQVTGDLKKAIAWSKTNDVYINIQERRDTIDQLWNRIKIIKKRQCRNPNCVRNIGGMNEKIYSAIIQNSKGREIDQMYFCSNKCWSIIKEKCGMIQKNHKDQETIDINF